jgi:hypothetical protein
VKRSSFCTICRCGTPITCVPRVDIGSGWYRLEAKNNGPLVLDATGRLRSTEQTGWHGTHRHHKCQAGAA